MKQVRVSLAGGRSYDIVIGNGISSMLADYAVTGKKILVFDDRTFELFSDKFADFDGECFSFGRGEADKTVDSVLDICRFAISRNLTRSSEFIAVGGGVTGDLTGFAAGIYLRGVKCIQVPTTLLAMVDSSVGGKTAADLPEGKNLIGVFHQPQAVLIDPVFLETLPARELHNGLAEIVKMAVGFDAEFFDMLWKAGDRIADFDGFAPYAESAIGRCCELKAEVVSQDERESASGIRELLNFGHTFGHAVESSSDFSLSHGESISIGMVLAGIAAIRRNMWSDENQKKLIGSLKACALPVLPPENITFNKIIDLIHRDKKNRSSEVTLILPRKLGELCVMRDFSDDELRDIWCAGGGRL